MLLPRIILLLLPLVSGTVCGLPTTVRLAVGENKPPYTFLSPPSGIEYDVLVAVVERMGCRPDIVMVPNARARMLLEEEKVDGAIGVTGDIVSQPYIAYQNAAISLFDRGVNIQTIGDLKNYRVVAFQNAHIFLGPEFAAMAEHNPNYSEVSPQVVANQLLFGGRVDVVVSDVHIFDWLNRQASIVDVSQRVVVHHIFPPTRYRIVFHDRNLRDAFDKALTSVLAENPYPALVAKYLPDPLGSDFRP